MNQLVIQTCSTHELHYITLLKQKKLYFRLRKKRMDNLLITKYLLNHKFQVCRASIIPEFMKIGVSYRYK